MDLAITLHKLSFLQESQVTSQINWEMISVLEPSPTCVADSCTDTMSGSPVVDWTPVAATVSHAEIGILQQVVFAVQQHEDFGSHVLDVRGFSNVEASLAILVLGVGVAMVVQQDLG